MPEIEDQLQAYGEAFEREIGQGIAYPEVRSRSRRRPLVRAAAIAALATLLVIIVLAGTRFRPSGDVPVATTADSTEPARAGVFTVPTDTVLLLSDGLSGVIVVDLDRRLVARAQIPGERAGDQPFRLHLTGDHLVVGWGEIFTWPLAGGDPTAAVDATIHIPAAEPGEFWTIRWDGGRIGLGESVVQRVTVDGEVTFRSNEWDPSWSVFGGVLGGVPGGLVVNTTDGLAVWSAASESITQRLSSNLGTAEANQGTAVASDGTNMWWCEIDCTTVRHQLLEERGAPTARHIMAGRQSIAISPRNGDVAILEPNGAGASIIVKDASGTERTVTYTDDLDPLSSIFWSADGAQLFYVEPSSPMSELTIGLWDTRTDKWERQVLPFGGGTGGIAMARNEATYFMETAEHFFTPDSPDRCNGGGSERTIVPDLVGLTRLEASIAAQAAGLSVVGEIDPAHEDDPVLNQEPPAGAEVSEGACIGFRTDN